MRRTLVPLIEVPPRSPVLGGVIHDLRGATMGTTWSVRFVGAAGCRLDALEQAVQRQLDTVVSQMSTWDPDSDLSRFNRAAPGTWHAAPAELFAVLSYALQVARDSGGAYDPTAGTLVNLWGFGPTQRYTDAGFRAPDAATLAAARAQCGWQRLALDAATQRVLQPGGIYLDLSAIAKGFGVDQVARLLRGQRIDSFLVEVGGELRGEGTKPDGQPWWVQIEHPPVAAPAMPPETVVALHGLSVASSGDYRRYFDAGGTRYSHTIDPRNGAPIRHGLAAVTVLHADCMAADALSTALGVMGVGEGIAYAHRHALAALFVTRGEAGFEETMSAPLAALLQ